MPDIRLVRPRSSHVVAWTASLAILSVLIWVASTLFLGDATQANVQRQVGARANFGADRGAVLPLQTESFEDAQPIEDRELGRLLRIQGTAESAVRANSLWVRSRGGKRILVRFDPAPPEGALRRVTPGAGVTLDGYIQKIARAEFDAWMDTLNVVIPRPRPGTKFGDVPDSTFARVDTLFIKNYFLSVRPEGIGGLQPAPVPTPGADSAAAAGAALPAMGDSAGAARRPATPATRPTQTATPVPAAPPTPLPAPAESIPAGATP